MNYYLNNYAVRDQLIDDLVHDDLGMVVVIPCHNEVTLITALESLFNCDLPPCSVEVITVINASEDAPLSIIEQNKQTLSEAEAWAMLHSKSGLSYHFIEENTLPPKHAGVVLARKIGMDEAVRRLETVNNPKGIIVCFDADAKCTPNYLVEIERHFKTYPKTPACSIHFEHPIEGKEFSKEIYDGIIQYELHLRGYKNGLAYAGLPYAYHTVGSSMAVLSHIYQKQNGMNKRKAGEDFYFLQKLIPLGGFTELTTAKVIPSPRVSDRVPFGTGKAIADYVAAKEQIISSYNSKSYVDLKQFCEVLPDCYDDYQSVSIPKSIRSFLESMDWERNYNKIRSNSTSKDHFIQLFFKWFNAFKVLKYMHHTRDYFYPDQPVFDVGNSLLTLLGKKQEENLTCMLQKYRVMDQTI